LASEKTTESVTDATTLVGTTIIGSTDSEPEATTIAGSTQSITEQTSSTVPGSQGSTTGAVISDATESTKLPNGETTVAETKEPGQTNNPSTEADIQGYFSLSN
jgi:hypothetical protein